MNSKRLTELRTAVHRVVRSAAKQGLIEREEFTLGVARKQVEEEMKLEKDSLKDKEWKGIFKKEVEEALAKIDDSESAEEPQAEASGSDSEMSSVYDAPPRKRKNKTAGESSKPKEKKPRKSAGDAAKEDDQVTSLKKIVTACGVRKQWTKEFADCPTPASQVRHLRQILLDLGLKGTPTIGKAKALKEKRELAAELDDIQEFEAARGAHGSRRRGERDSD